MKPSIRVLTFLLTPLCIFLFATPAKAQCINDMASCVTSVTISPGTILGDGTETADVTVGLHIAGTNPWTFYLQITEINFGSTQTFCPYGSWQFYPGAGCRYPNIGPGNVTVSFSINGWNQSTTTQNGTVKVQNYADYDVGMTAPINVTPVTPPVENPPLDPDLPCNCDGSTGSPSAGSPINLLNGNTWITQQDYSIPGLGGGLTLMRTWNSFWPLTNPVEASSIFGDSWRSNLEERIQVQAGGTVKYWKGNGSSLFYAYSGSGGVYNMTAPADDQTQLSFNSGTSLWTATLKDGTRKIFNNAGYLTSIIDRNGNTISIAIDSAHQNRIASVTDAANRTLTFNYTNANFPRLCTSVTDAAGTIATYTYDASGRLTQLAYPDGSQFNFSYDSNNLILSVTDSQGKVIEAHTYDAQRRGLTSQQANDANGNPVNKVTVQYFPWWSPSSIVVSDSLNDPSVSLAISDRAQRHYLASTSGSAPCSTCGFPTSQSSTYSASGYRTSYTDPNRNTSLYAYDSQGNMLSKYLPNSTAYDIWNYTYNSFGQVLTATDPLGNTTSNQYDASGNLLSTTTPSPDGVLPGSTTSFTYDNQGQMLTITDPLNHQTTITYYPTGLIHTITDAQNNTTTYAYDTRGNRTSVTDPAGHQTQFQYDVMNRLTQITYADNSAVHFHYDYRGRRDSVTDQNNKTTTYAYDDADRLTSVTDAANHVTRYVYNTESRLTHIYDANNNHTQFAWINGSLLYMTTFPSGYYETYNWDGYRTTLYSKVDRNGNSHSYSYDAQNRLYQWDGYVTAIYDAASRMTQVTDGYTGSTWTFAYDNMGRLRQTTTKYAFLSGRNTFTVSYAYDAASNRTSMTDPENGTTQYTYDSLKRLINLQDFQSHNFGFSYDQLSRRTQLTRPNGVNTNYSYDNLSHLLSVLHQVGVNTLDGASYT